MNDHKFHNNEDLISQDKERFEYVKRIVEQVEIREISSNKFSFQDKIDGILTNRWLGI